MSFSAGSGANKRVVIEFIGNDTSLTSTLTRVDRNLKTTMESGKIAVTSIGTAFQTSATKADVFTGSLQQMNTRTAQFTGALGNMATSTNTTSTSFGALNNAIKETNTFQGSVVSSANKATDSIGNLGDAGAKTGGKMDKLKEAFSGNRGLIYSMGTIFGTMTGVVAELQLLEDANGQVAEATEKLNKLQEEGKQGTQEYSQAQQQLEKANRFLGFTTRNLSLAFANFVPEILLLATNLSRSEGLVGKITGAFGGLKGSTSGLGGALSNVGAGATTAAGGISRLSTAVKVLVGIAGFEILGRVWTDLLQKGNPAIKTIHDFGTELEKIPVIGPALKLFGDIMNQVFLPDQWAKEQERLKGLKDGTDGLANATKKYIPDAKLLAEAQADLAAKTQIVTDAEKAGGPTHKQVNDMRNAQIKVNRILAGTYTDLTTGMDDNTTSVIKNNGIWLDLGNNVKKTLPSLISQKEVAESSSSLFETFATSSVHLGAGLVKVSDAAIKAKGAIASVELGAEGTYFAFEQMIKKIEEETKVQEYNRLQTIKWLQAHGDMADLTKLSMTELETHVKAVFHDKDAIAALTKATDTQTDSLDTNVKSTDDLSKAAEEAAADFNKFLKSATENEAKTRALDVMYAQLGQTMTKDLNPTIALTQEDLTKLGKTFKDGQSTTSKLADIINDKLAPSFQVLSSVLEADTFKDFKKNFKDLNLDKLVGKDLEKSLQKALSPLAKLSIKSKDVEELFSVLVQGGENLSDVDWSKATGKLANNLEKLGKIDPDAASEPMKKIFESVKTMTPEQLQQHAKSFDYLFKAMKGGLTKEEAATFQEMFNKENAGSIGTMGTNAGVAAPKLDSVAEALNSVNLAGKDVADRMSKIDFEFPPPKLDKIAETLNDTLKAAKQTTQNISAISYSFPSPNLNLYDNILRKSYDHAKSVTQKNIAKIKYNFPPPDLKKFDDVLRDAYKHAKQVVANINALKATIHVKYQVDNKPPAGTKLSHATLSDINSHANLNDNAHMGNLNVTLINTDEFSQAKLKKFKASLGKGSYRFG